MFKISWRYLWSRKKQTILIFLGVVLGTGAYVVISGMMLGFQDTIKEKMIDNEPHITITKKDKRVDVDTITYNHYQDKYVFWRVKPGGYRTFTTIQNPPFWNTFLTENSDVYAFAKNLTLEAMARRSSFELPIRLIGTNPKDQVKVTNMMKYMTQGSFLDLGESGKKIIVGSAFLDKIGAQLGETLEIVLANGQKDSFKIVGVFELGIKNIDETTLYAGIQDVQSLRNTPGAVTQISVRLNDVLKARTISKEWQLITDEKVSSWEENSESILSVFNTQNIVRNFMTISILVVASFGIYNILSILISQKKKDIAIFRTIGFYPEDIEKIFLWQGLIIGLVGGVLGMVIGHFICQYLSTVVVASGRITGHGSRMLISFDYLIYVKACLLAFGSCLFSSYFPARQAGKLEPMEILRES